MCLQGRNHGRTEARGNVSFAPTRPTDGAGRNPGGTRSPDTASRDRDDPGRHGRRPAHRRVAYDGRGGVRHRHAGTPSRLSREAVTRRRVPLRLREEPPSLVRTSPERKGVAQVLWCADLSCGCARICRAGVRADLPCSTDSSGRSGSVSRLRPASQTGMIEALPRDRQYSPQKKFRFCIRNFQKRPRTGRRTPVPPSAAAAGPGPGRARERRSPASPLHADAADRSAVPPGSGPVRPEGQLVNADRQALRADTSAPGLDQRAPRS